MGQEFYVSARRARSEKKRWESQSKSERLNLPEDLWRAHHRFDEFRERIPSNREQRIAWSKCQEVGHDWMHDAEFSGNGYDVETSQTSNNTPGIRESTSVIIAGPRRMNHGPDTSEPSTTLHLETR
jgi:hypothetical protein